TISSVKTSGLFSPCQLKVRNVGSYYEEYSFTGRAGQQVVIEMSSADFDTYLLLLGPDGSLIAENDDISSGNLNSQIVVTLPTNGVYTIVTNGYDSASLGRYDLTVTTALGTGDLQITLSWNSIDDLDLVVMDPEGNLVSFETPRIASGGQLDVDANSLCQGVTSRPVENVFWPNGAPGGEYQVFVSLYSRCANSQGPIPFTLTMNVQGTVETFDGTVDETNDLVVVPTAVY
ncbi:MAG: pre-peptidase C-terminal domain-containing protein, partial [Cyanobacteria bacterium]|nr:pre-peptidase C-terminal domain-containing protein [Cyanobacteriota bacterium]